MNKLNLFKNSEISENQFLQQYWHKKPLLIPAAVALTDLEVLPNKKKLMQLSCDENVQSRIVFKASESEYDVELGPFVFEDLKNFDDYCWNLLISDVDKWQPKSREILKYFRFIRNWIFDDIMISTGSVGGTVGPHTDHYDVFLIQVHGQRNWKYCHDKTYDPELMSEQALKLMKYFNEDESYILNPGDVLYLPPELAHYGIATSEDCVTCSVGVRTPSHAELLTSFVDEITQKLSENSRFEEPQFELQPKSGEVTNKDLDNIKEILTTNLINKNDSIENWFGRFITEYRSLFYEFNSEQDVQELPNNNEFIFSSFTKSCYFKNNDEAKLFVNGELFNSSLNLAEKLCNDKLITKQQIKKLIKEDLEIIKTLYKNGSLIITNSNILDL